MVFIFVFFGKNKSAKNFHQAFPTSAFAYKKLKKTRVFVSTVFADNMFVFESSVVDHNHGVTKNHFLIFEIQFRTPRNIMEIL